jgi:TPR repeat protein
MVGEGNRPEKLKGDTQASFLYRKSAEGGDKNGMRLLSTMYASGRGGPPRDEAQTAYWRKAAES